MSNAPSRCQLSLKSSDSSRPPTSEFRQDPPPASFLRLISDAAALALPHPWRIVYANSGLTKWVGASENDPVSWPMERVLHSAGGVLQQQLERIWNGEVDLASTSGTLRNGDSDLEVPVRIRLAAVRDADQTYVGLVIQQVAQRDSMAIGRCDPLTGLADRSQLFSRLGALLAGDRLADRQFAVLFIDLDDFKRVNDRHGHLAGDRVLSEVACRLQGCIRDGDLMVRYGGDEFVVLLEQVAGWDEYGPVIARIQAAVAEPIAISTGGLTLSVSIGAAEVSPDHRTPEDILTAADRAMYAAKRRSKSSVLG